MNQALPLAGITVVELGSSLAAPYAALILGEMGAEVIKIEHPDGGDVARYLGKPGPNGYAHFFEAFNRNKKSVTIDFTKPDELSRLRRLIIEQADVVLQNLRPGVVEDLGIDAQTFMAEKPSLVYCNLGAYGGTGPMSMLPGYDPLMQAFSGLCDVTGPADGEPCRVGPPVIDQGTGMWAAMGILAQLAQRNKTGKGGVVDVALFETAMAFMTLPMANIIGTGKYTPRGGMLGGAGVAPNRAYETQDGSLVVIALTERQFRNMCAALGHAEWIDDPRFASNPLRWRNEAELRRLMNDVLRIGTRAHWTALLDKAGVPSAPVQTPIEALNHPHTQAGDLVRGSADGASPQVLLPVKFDHKRPAYRHRAPQLGEHNELLK